MAAGSPLTISLTAFPSVEEHTLERSSQVGEHPSCTGQPLISKYTPHPSALMRPVPAAPAMMVRKPLMFQERAREPWEPSTDPQHLLGSRRRRRGGGATPSLPKAPGTPHLAASACHGQVCMGTAGQAQTPLEVSRPPADGARRPAWTRMLSQTRSSPQPSPP